MSTKMQSPLKVTGMRRLTQHIALRSSVLTFPKKVALVDMPHGYKKETYEELWLRSNRLANALTNLGMEKGDKVAYWLGECTEVVEIWYATSKIGAVWAGVNAQYKGKEAEYVINHSDAEAIIVSPEHVDQVKSIQSNLKNIKHYIVLGEKDVEGMRSYEALLAKSSAEDPEVEVRDNDWDSLTYTSGTTGLPSGSMRSHTSGLAWELTLCQCCGFTHDTRVLSWYPNYHWGGPVCTRPTLMMGGTRWIPGAPDAKEALEVIQRDKINFIATLPSIAVMLCTHPDIGEYDTSSVKVWLSGGSAFLMPQRELVAKRFPNAQIIEIYTCTEAFFTWATHEETLKLERASGKPAPGNEVKIFDGDGNELPSGEWGLICVRGISVHDGYYKNPEKTKNSLINDEWFTAEDIGFKDEDNNVYVSDRAKDIINTGGELVYPVEVENVLLTHPKVAECAVVSSPDPIYNEKVTACVILKSGEEGTEALADELKEFCRTRMASFKIPRRVDFVSEIPKVGSGKIDKKAIRAEYWREEKFKV